MPLIPESERLETLRSWGVSEPLLRLSAGELLHRTLQDTALGPPWYIYRGTIWIPSSGLLAPLWESSSKVEALIHRDSRIEFVRFSFDSTSEQNLELLSLTEAGFWVRKFDFLYECDEEEGDLREAAAAVGFSRIDDYLAERAAAEPSLGTTEEHERWLQAQVRRADSGNS